MNKPGIGLAPEGVPIIGLLTVVSLCFAILDWWPAALVALVALWFSVHFFRDPERVVPQEKGLAVSPADGRIIRIEKRTDPMNGEERLCISIFMNIFSVHVNRAPVSGTVIGIRYLPGKFFNAAWDKASTDNEQCLWQMRDEEGATWTFVQIAGLIARRIVPHAEQGDVLRRGQRFGMIRFGSRVDVYLPSDYTAAIRIGENVFAGQSVLAKKSASEEA
ncbi:phosphatidylserine decarboxylase family protein [Mailhella massiliensis]|uniref:Phosphatidylserine decarboxylase proenzyme n=1 Tax=Mailhella massiliensis TaxID=1903261 RepID=A0A921AWG4_9BACT|nr:phosphatidylserine decarboxylase family protein [Mailhella massiliensis]HJD97403.1 phosphatidylserine decarboxylase family protein [Mailhella massiliensis]